MKILNNKSGFTLLELIVVISIIGMVITTIFSIVIFGYDVYGRSTDDFIIQSDVRLAMQEVSETIRDSKALFAVPDVSYKDEQWNYIGLSDDQRMIIDFRWNTTTKVHDEKVLVGPYDGITFDIKFDKENSMSRDNTLRMYFEAYTNNGLTKRFDILSGYEALNSLQVINYGTSENPAKALAYRADEFHYENMKVLVNIALVLDTSGSMNYDLLGNSQVCYSWWNCTSIPLDERRIKILKDQTGLLIEQFAANTNENVEIRMALVEYNTNANNVRDFRNVKTQKAQLVTDVNNLCQGSSQNCSGGTNTGDGLRRAYYELEDIRNEQLLDYNDPQQEIVIKNYVILLTDGVYSFYSNEVKTLSQRSEWVCTSYRGNSNNCRTWEYLSIDAIGSIGYFLGNGNILYTKENYNSGTIPAVVGATFNYGRGSGEDVDGLEYIELVSDLGLNDNASYTNYLIGFGLGNTSERLLGNIQGATNTDETRVFSADDADQLGLSFTNIQMSITNDTWHYLGPKLIGE